MGQLRLGRMYLDGKWVQKDLVKGLELVRQSGEQGNIEAVRKLRFVYENGSAGITPDNGEAARWLRMCAELGDSECQYDLGVNYSQGKGVGLDKVEAAKWYRKSAEQDYQFGQAALGISYEYGDGVAQDKAEAAKWYQKAAAKGNKSALEGLRRLTSFSPSH